MTFARPAVWPTWLQQAERGVVGLGDGDFSLGISIGGADGQSSGGRAELYRFNE